MSFRKPKKWAIAGTSLALITVLGLHLKFQSIFVGHSAPSPENRASAQAGAAKPTPSPGLDAQALFCQDFYRSVCLKGGEGHDPTGAVRPDVIGEILALRSYEEIIHAHHDWNPSQVDAELVRRVYTSERVKRIQWAFRRAQLLLTEFIDRQPARILPKRIKAMLKDRLKQTHLELPMNSDYSDVPDLYTKNDVYFESTGDGKLRMRVGGAYLITAKSRFNILFTVSHELAHSIDPCEMMGLHVDIPAYDALESCFLKTGVIAQPPHRTRCGDTDQFAEAFADWMATQATSDSLSSFATEFQGSQVTSAVANTVRDLCEQEEGSMEVDLTQHPPARVRISRIFGNNPRIRTLLGCSPNQDSSMYCGFDFEPVEPGSTPTPQRYIGENPSQAKTKK